MLETFFYYFLLFIFIFISTSLIKMKSFRYLKYVLIIVLSLFIGLRYDVGIDYLEYLREFNLAHTTLNERFEIIPRYTQYYLSYNNFPYYYWFCLMAFIQVYLLIIYFKKSNIVLLQIGVIIFLLMYLSFITNIIRQMCAVLIFLNAIQFIEKRKIIPYFVMIFLGSLFHKSILIMLPFYFVNIFNFVNFKLIFQLSILLISFFLGTILNKYLFIFLEIFYFLGYEYAVNNFDLDDTLMIKEGTGFGRLINWVIIIIIMVYNDKMKVYFKDESFLYKTVFNLFFIHCIFYEFTGHILYFQRVFLFFTFTNFLMYSFLIYYCFKIKTKELLLIRLIGIFVLSYQIIIFIISILGQNKNISPLKFVDFL